MVNAQKITANTSFYMASLVFQKILSFIYFTLLARTLGVEATGQYFFAISFATMFSVLIDVGLSPVLIREVARDREQGDRWFHQIFAIKLILTVATAVFLVILNNLFFLSDQVYNLIYLSIAIVIIDSFTLFFYAYIRGRQSLRWESWGTIIFQIIVMVVGLSLMRVTSNVFLLLSVLFWASLFNMIYSAFILRYKFDLKFKLRYSRKLARQIYLFTIPFGLAAIFAKIYAYIDTFFLKIFLDDLAVGFYSIAYKITFALQFIPLAFVAALYPAFARYFKDDYDSLERTFVKSFHYLAFISIPLTLGIIALSDEIISKLYTAEFAFSILPLQVLIAGIPFLFINFALANFLNATNRQKINTRNLGIVMVVNIFLNIIFIKQFGIWGASLASSTSTLLLFVINLKAVMSVVSIGWAIFKPVVLALVAGILMWLSVIYLKTFIPWYLTILTGAMVYLVFMFATKTLRKRDVAFIKNSFFRNQ